MKKFIIIFILILTGTLIFFYYSNEEACAGSKCYYKIVCQGNANIKANVCATDCSKSETKEKAIEAFKKKCSSPPSSLSSYHSGWKDCDITLD